LEFPHFCRDCGNGNREAATIAVVTRCAPLPCMVVFRSETASVPSCSRPSRTSPSGGREKRGPSLTATRRDGAVETAVGAEEWLRRGQTKEWVRKQVSCQDFVVTIREGRHQFSRHKNRNNRRFPHQIPWWCSNSLRQGRRLSGRVREANFMAKLGSQKRPEIVRIKLRGAPTALPRRAPRAAGNVSPGSSRTNGKKFPTSSGWRTR
jgi:hypothetical protein